MHLWTSWCIYKNWNVQNYSASITTVYRVSCHCLCFSRRPSLCSRVFRFTPEVQYLQWTGRPGRPLSARLLLSASWLCWCDYAMKRKHLSTLNCFYSMSAPTLSVLNAIMSKLQFAPSCGSYLFSAVFIIACIRSSMVDLMRNLWTNVGLVDREKNPEMTLNVPKQAPFLTCTVLANQENSHPPLWSSPN